MRAVLKRNCVRDASMSVKIVRSLPLKYAEGANAALDRPAHVRAGSSLQLVKSGTALAVVQDDANFLALVDPKTFSVSSLALPADQHGKRLFDETRGTKKHKMDMEASVVGDDGSIILFGSGSSSARERIAIVNPDTASVRVVNLHVLYEKLRKNADFSGSDLNIEGAARIGSTVLRLFNRNNGEAKNGLVPVNATCDLDWASFAAFALTGYPACPEIQNVVQYDLGSLGGVSLGFTDATSQDGRVFFSGSAEASPNATQDGPVTGSVIGVMKDEGEGRWIEVKTSEGADYTGKIEGLVVLPGAKSGFAIVDMDSTEIPSELLFLELHMQ